MAFSPSKFKTGLSSGGGPARPSLYKIKINEGIGSLSFSDTETLLVKAASLPASNIAPLAVNYAGRAYKWQGFRTYDNWSVTISNDEDFSIRNKMMQWMRWISGQMDGERNANFGPPALGTAGGGWFDGDATVTQVGTDGDDRESYKMFSLWPTELGEIAVDWSSDAIQEYTIGFAYDFITKGSVGSASSTENIGMMWDE